MKNKESIEKKHQEDFGYTIPKDFFKESKENILSAIKEEKPQRKKVFFLNKTVYQIAASIIFFIGVVYLFKTFNSNSENNINNREQIVETKTIPDDIEDLYIESLLSEEKSNEFIDDYLVHNLIGDANQNKEGYEDLIIDSMLSDEETIEVQIDQYIIEEIIL